MELQFPEILDDTKIPESEFISNSLQKKELTEEEVYVKSMNIVEAKLPRIHKLILLMWGHPKDFDPWFDNILLDDRGNRQGFPTMVMDAIINLHDVHVKKFGAVAKKQDVWTANRKIF